jgi:hypothetical protein
MAQWQTVARRSAKRRATSPYVPSGHRVFHVACARERGFTGKQSHFATRGSVIPTGHLVIGPMSIDLYTCKCVNL